MSDRTPATPAPRIRDDRPSQEALDLAAKVREQDWHVVAADLIDAALAKAKADGKRRALADLGHHCFDEHDAAVTVGGIETVWRTVGGIETVWRYVYDRIEGKPNLCDQWCCAAEVRGGGSE